MSEKIVTLDVREDLRNGREPFSKVMGTIAKLRLGEKLRIIAPFEPTPLFSVLDNQCLEHESKQIPSSDWEVLFTRRSGEVTKFVPPVRPPCSAMNPGPTEIIDVDARGLEPPQYPSMMTEIGRAMAGARSF